MGEAPVARRPLLSVSVRGVAAVWAWRRLQDEAGEGPMALARAAGPAAGRELEEFLAGLREAARQWAERGSGDGGVSIDERAKVVVAPVVSASPVMDEITTAEAGRLLGCTPQRVGQLIAAEQLAARRQGRSWRISRRSVVDLLDARRSA